MLMKTLALATVGAVLYQKYTSEQPKLFFYRNAVNLRLIQALPLLTQKYQATPWLVNPHLQIAYYTARHYLTQTTASDDIEYCKLADGTTTELVWLNRHLDAQTPTIVVLHTITASIQTMRELLCDLSQLTGWRIVLCCRRGHGTQPQPFSSVNIMGSVPDFKVQLAHIHNSFPNSALYALGSSAGSATLARYLGEVGADSPLKAAFLYCLGYDMKVAFDRVNPLYDYYLASAVKKKFLKPYQASLQHLASYQKVIRIKKLSQMHQQLYQFAGFATQHDYLHACNPADVLANIQIPTMILNAEDDPICHIDNSKPYISSIENNPSTILVTTHLGSHCGHYTGWKPYSWANRLITNYFHYVDKTRTYPQSVCD